MKPTAKITVGYKFRNLYTDTVHEVIRIKGFEVWTRSASGEETRWHLSNLRGFYNVEVK